MTVGIVLVSHSAAVANGAAELARAMAGDVAVEPAGGLDEPGEPLGTDAVRVADAIGRADSGDGVLVLMDLGSAVLSAETALDLLDGVDDAGEVRLTAAPLVEGAVAAAVAAQAGGSLADVEAEARRGLAAKAAHLGEEQPAEEPAGEQAAAPDEAGEGARAVLDVPNQHGLHGRPAARFVRTVARFDAEVRVADLTNGRGPVSARSLAGIMALGVDRGHRIEVTATGGEAAAAIDALRALAAEGYGDGAGDQAPTPASVPAPRPTERPGDATFHGLPAAPGSAYGAARRLRAAEPPDPDRRTREPEDERRRLAAALGAVRTELEAARDAAGLADAAGILDMQVLLVDDEAFAGAALAAVGDGVPAGRAVRQAAGRLARTLAADADPYRMARAEDVEDVARRVLARLAGATAARVSGEGVVVADLLGPGDTVGLDRGRVRGLLTARGAPAGHAAILARALGIPAVVGAGEAVLRVEEGQPVLVDGDTGAVYVQPGTAVRHRYEERRAAAAEVRAEAQRLAGEPAVTRDGVRIVVEANVGSLADAEAAAGAGAEGVGLLRTELWFLGRDEPPGEDEQAEVYAAVATRLGGAEVTVRTLDVGADKPAAYLRQDPEDNPFLGVRGLRLGLARPEVLRTQLRAVVRAAARHPVRVMVPMVTTVDELDAARALLDWARQDVAGGGGPVPERVPFGAMVEVPAVALLADAFAARVDFLSVGTNDLTQYVLAAERGNPHVAGLGDACHPAVLALLARVVEAGERHGCEVAVCGEIAGDPAAVPLLVGLGVTRLSAAPTAVPLVKQAVRATVRAEAADLARTALAATSAAEVRALLSASPG